MKVAIDSALPIAARADDISSALRDHQVIVVAGETGSGKTTQLPKIAYLLGQRHIAHTQPRRIAARSVAQRIAQECQTELGAEVGYAVRFDDRSTPDTAIRLMTDGLLLSEIHTDRQLRRYDTIIIDEAHERSLAIDFLLGYLATLLPHRPDLKVVITSATIDVERFSEAFGGAPVLEVSGRTYPVDIRYRPLDDDQDSSDGIVAAIDELPADGDVLVFLTGERDIADIGDLLAAKHYPRSEILPLYGRLSSADQHKVFAPHSQRRIVLATNVAETSLTVPGIRYVIDPGLARVSRYSQRLKVQRLPIEPISQASAAQRAGRSGRVAEGICIRLYSQADFDARPNFTEPEIRRTNLASVRLQMAALELGPMDTFGFIDPPDARAVKDANRILVELGALHKDRLTAVGRKMAAIPADPRLARMLLGADQFNCVGDVLVIVSALSIQDPRERPLERQGEADEKHRRFNNPTSDFLSWLTLWKYVNEQRAELGSSAFRRMCRDEFLHFVRLREWSDVHAQLSRTARELGLKPGPVGADADDIHRALLTGLLSNIGIHDPSGRTFRGTRGAEFMIYPGSGLAKKPPPLVMAAELVETTRLWARMVAAVQPEWVEKAAGRLVTREYSDPYWSKKRATAMATEQVSLFGVRLISDRTVNVSSFDRDLAREMFIRHALVGDQWRTHHRFAEHNRALLAEYDDAQARRRTDRTVDEEVLFEFFNQRVPEQIGSVRHFDSWWKRARKVQPDLLNLTADVLDHDERDDVAFPDVWTCESREYQLSYRFEPGAADDGVTVELPVSDVMAVPTVDFAWGVPGRRLELVEALIRSLPKPLRREFVPAQATAQTVTPQLDPAAGDLLTELGRVLSELCGTTVAAADFEMSAVPDHLRVTFRIVDGDQQLAVGKDLPTLQDQVRPHTEADLRTYAASIERSGLKTFDIPELQPSISVGQAVGYPTLIDEGDSVALRVLDSPIERDVAMIGGQSRLLSFAVPTCVPAIGRTLDLRTKLLLGTGPDGDATAVLDQIFVTVLDHLVTRHGGPARTAQEFVTLRDAVRSDVYDLTAQAVPVVSEILQAAGDVQPDQTPAGEDARVQLSWLIYPGFIRDTGFDRLARIRLYLQTLQRSITRGDHQNLEQVQQLEARFHDLTASASPLRRLADDVQNVRWALEELRISLFAQQLRADRPISISRVESMLSELNLS